MVRAILLTFLCLLPTFGYSQQDPLSAYVDRTEVSLNDVFTLTIRVDSGLSNTPPALDGLDQDFEQLGTSRSSSFTLINNVSESWTEYRISLRARHAGELVIPAFRIGSQVTSPITVTVNDASRNPANRDDFFLVTSVSKDEVYVQEQLLYSVKIYFATPFDQGAQLGTPQAPNAVIQQLGNDSSYQEVIDGLRYNVIERRYVLFPQSSGELEISAIDFSATVGRRRGLFTTQNNGGRVINLQSESHSITVKSKPDSFPATATWLPSSNLQLEETWSGSLQGIQTGEAITRNLSIRADGLSSSLLPDLAYPDIDGLKFYPDQPSRDDLSNQNGVTGIRSQGTAIVASEGGDFTLPAIELPWWNTQTDSLEYARLPAQTLSIIAGRNQAGEPLTSDNTPPVVNTDLGNVTQESAVPFYWVVATVAFAAAWLFSTAMWFRSRASGSPAMTTYGARQSTPDSNEKSPGSKAETAFRVFEFACQEDELGNVRKSLLSWARLHFDDRRILSLDTMNTHIKDPELHTLLDQLESALYGSAEAQQKPDCKLLLQKVKALHKQGIVRPKKTATESYTLPPLYKN